MFYLVTNTYIIEFMKTITFFVPVFNEEKNIFRCLQSIRKQNYPQNLVEIFIADAGCTDKTIQIAKKFKIKYYFNKKKLSEYAYQDAIKLSKGELFVFFAADNELVNIDWITKMVEPFSLLNADAAFTHIAIPKNSPLVNQYYSELHVEPLSWFVYRDSCNPKNFSNYYEVIYNKKNLIEYKFSKKNFPLIATAQGFVVKKKKFNFIDSHDGDDILPIIKMIQKRKKIIYVNNTGIYHHHICGYLDYFQKYGERARRALSKENYGFFKRKKIYSNKRKLFLYLFIPYSLSFLFPLIDSVLLYLKNKKKYMLLHSLMTPLLGLSIIKEYLRKFFN